MAGHSKVRKSSRRRNATTSVTVIRSQAVKLLGVSDRSFSRLQAEGVIVPLAPARGRRPATYDAVAILAAYREHQVMEESPRDQRDLEQAALLRLRRKREEGELWPRADIERAGRSVLETVKARLRRIDYELVRAGVIPPEGQPLVRQAVDDVLRELARLPRLMEAR